MLFDKNTKIIHYKEGYHYTAASPSLILSLKHPQQEAQPPERHMPTVLTLSKGTVYF